MEKQKKKFYQSNWFLWLCLFFFAPVGIGLLWIFHKEKKIITKIILTIIFVIWFIPYSQGVSDGYKDSTEGNISIEDDVYMQSIEESSSIEETISIENEVHTQSIEETSTAEKETSIYEEVEIIDVMNGTRTEKLGEYSLIKTNSGNVSIEALTDWYFNYVQENDYNWCMILYTDKADNSGVYASQGMIQENVIFTEDEYGEYSLSDANAMDNAIIYIPTDNGTLEELE